LQPYPVKKKIETPPRNSARVCGRGRGLSWAVEPREEEEEEEEEGVNVWRGCMWLSAPTGEYGSEP
jgi:hypothetical protein